MSKAPHDDALMLDLPLGSREELERALNDRTRPTDEDAACMAALDGLDLRQAVYRASDALAVFDEVLLELQDESFCLTDALESMDAAALTSDHGWSDVLHMLAGLPEEGDELRAVGLVKYRRYLRNRLETLDSRQKLLTQAAIETEVEPEAPDATDEHSSSEELVLDLELLADDDEQDPPVLGFDQATVMYRAEDVVAEPGREARAGTDPEPGDALAESAIDGRDGAPRLMRLHRGKPVALAVAGRDQVELWLGRSRFRLLLDDGPRLVSDHTKFGRLRNGRSLVGRSPDCEVVISARYDTVSRVHLEVEVDHGQLVAVTDLSSGGTYVRPELVPRRTNAA